MNNIIKSFNVGLNVVQSIYETQKDNIEKAGHLIALSRSTGNKFFVTGSGHSHTVAEEFYGRAGQLSFVTPILNDELTLTNHPTKSTYLERLPGYAKILVELYRIKEGDIVLIASNSGRNAYPVEMAYECKKVGAKVIAITNMKHTTSVTSRHESNKNLYQFADVIIDNCGEKGDASTYFNGVNVPMNPTSSIANAFICNAIAASVVEHLIQLNINPEVFYSANVDGGEEKNQELMDKYMRMYY